MYRELDIDVRPYRTDEFVRGTIRIAAEGGERMEVLTRLIAEAIHRAYHYFDGSEYSQEQVEEYLRTLPQPNHDWRDSGYRTTGAKSVFEISERTRPVHGAVRAVEKVSHTVGDRQTHGHSRGCYRTRE